jgi:uncharacterized protein (TIGR02246 family)
VTDAEARAALDAFDRAFAAGDAAALAEHFTADARLLLLHSEPIEGRDAVHAHWAGLFARYDTSAWRTDLIVMDVLGDRAFSVATYAETLVPRHAGEGQRQLVRGRLVRFQRRDADGRWRVWMALNSHSRPVEPLD